MTSYFVTKPISDSGTIGLVGAVSLNTDGPISQQGYHWISYTQRGNSRKPRATVEAAVPIAIRRAGAYLVRTKTAQDAVDLTVAYRDGTARATDAALLTEIRQ